MDFCTVQAAKINDQRKRKKYLKTDGRAFFTRSECLADVRGQVVELNLLTLFLTANSTSYTRTPRLWEKAN